MWLISRSSTNGYAHSTHLFGTGYLQVTFVRKIQTVCEGESKQCFLKRWFFRVETRLWNHCSSCGICGGEVASGQVSLRVRGFFEALVFQSGGPSLKPLQLMWDLWWAKWHQGRFLWEYVGFPLLTTILPVFYINLSTVWGLENRAVTRGSSTETKTHPTTEININRESGRSFNLVCFT